MPLRPDIALKQAKRHWASRNGTAGGNPPVNARSPSLGHSPCVFFAQRLLFSAQQVSSSLAGN